MPKPKRSPRQSRHDSKRGARGKSRRDAAPERGTRRPVWSGTLSFGLVSIPVELYPATHEAHIGLRMLSEAGTPLERRYFCPEHEAPVPADEIARGYEYRPDRYVAVTDDELEALAPERSRDIDLQQFVAADAIDPVYFERSYFLMPAGESAKAYRLLARVLMDEHRAGIATFVLGDRECLAAILADDGVLSAALLRFHEELRSVGFLEDRSTEVERGAVKRYASLIEKHALDRFDPFTLHNAHNEALRELAARKSKDERALIAAPPSDDAPAETVDLMRMLKQSLRR